MNIFLTKKTRVPAAVALLTLLLCSSFVLHAQNKKLDSLEHKIRQHPQRDTTRARLIIDYSRAAINHNTSNLLPYLHEALSISKEQKFKRGFQSAYSYLQIYYSDRGDLAKSNAYADTAFMYLKNDTARIAIIDLAWLYNNVASNYAQLADYQQAINNLTKAAVIFEQYNPKALATIYGNIALMYAHLLLPERAMAYDRKAIAAAERSGDSLDIAKRNLGYVSRLIEAKKFDEAVSILNKAEPIVMKVDNSYAYIVFYQHKGLISKHRLQYGAAITHLKTAYNYTLQSDDKAAQVMILDPLTMALLEMGKLDEAKGYLDTLLAKSRMHNIRSGELNAYTNLAQWYQQKGDFKSAYEFLLKKISLSDSVSSQEMKEKIAAMETRFQVEGKNKEIKILQNEKRIQQLSIQQKNVFNYILTGSAAALLVIFLLSYRNYKNRQKLQQQRISELETEKQLLATQSLLKGQEDERSRLAKDLHDGLGGLLSGVKLQLGAMKGNLILDANNALAFDRALNKLDESIGEMRRVAHNMMPEALLKLGLQQAISDYCDSLSQDQTFAINCEMYGLEKRMDNTVEIVLYRIVQELLNNAVKHANASSILVQVMRPNDNSVAITIEDNGKGFDTGNINTMQSAGLQNIRSRVKYLNGTMDIKSAPGQGTSVYIECKL